MDLAVNVPFLIVVIKDNNIDLPNKESTSISIQITDNKFLMILLPINQIIYCELLSV